MDRVRPFRDPTAALASDPSAAYDSWRVDEGAADDDVIQVETPAEARKARELAAFQAQAREREASLRMRIIADGGSLLAS